MPVHKTSRPITLSDWQPTISLIIPYYSPNESWFNETLDSVFAQSIPALQIIIVNDHSPSPPKLPDETRRRARYNREHQILVIEQSRNQGLACSRNLGALYATAPYIVFLDPDDKLDPLALEKLLLLGVPLITHPVPKQLDFVYGFVYPGVVHFGSKNDLVYSDFDLQRLLQENFLTSAALISREAYLSVGGSCPRSAIHFFEDYDFWLRFASLGYQGKLLREPLFFYRRHDQGQSKSLIDGVSKDSWKAEARTHNPVTFGDMPRRTFCRLLQDRIDDRDLFPCYSTVVRTDSEIPKLWISKIKSVFGLRQQGQKSSRERHPWCSPIRKSLLEIADLPTRHPQFHDSPSNVIHVLYLLPWMNMGGADLYDQQLIQSLSESRHRRFHVTLVVARHIEHHPWESKFKPFVQEIFHLQRLSNSSESDDQILDYLLKSRKVALVINSRTAAGYNSIRKWKTKRETQYVKTVDILHLYELNSRSGWEWRSGQVASFLDLRLVVSQSLKEYQINVVGQGDMDLGYPSMFQPLTMEEEERVRVLYPPLVLQSRSAMIGDQVKPTLFFIGRLDSQKRPDLFIDVASKVPGVHVKVIGAGPLSTATRQNVFSSDRYLDLSRRIDFTGPLNQQDIPELLMKYSNSVLLMTSSHEGVPIVILEALATGTPVITSLCGGTQEVIRDKIWKSNPQTHRLQIQDKIFLVERHSHASLILMDCHDLLGPEAELRYHELIDIMSGEVQYRFEQIQGTIQSKGAKLAQQERLNIASDFRTKYSDRSFRKSSLSLVEALLNV
jgi:glycosyltransferase involved in cell wall biosynthesis/GT2 family glycosyltransferase